MSVSSRIRDARYRRPLKKLEKRRPLIESMSTLATDWPKLKLSDAEASIVFAIVDMAALNSASVVGIVKLERVIDAEIVMKEKQLYRLKNTVLTQPCASYSLSLLLFCWMSLLSRSVSNHINR